MLKLGMKAIIGVSRVTVKKSKNVSYYSIVILKSFIYAVMLIQLFHLC